MPIRDVVIEPMRADFIVWRCLHGGPLTRENMDAVKTDRRMPWDRLRARNVPLLKVLTEAYGACAILARHGDAVVGIVRFQPKAVGALPDMGGLCMQQLNPAGPKDDAAAFALPPLDQIVDRTLVIHCLMTAGGEYRRKGIGTQMVAALMSWARAHGWAAVEARAFEDFEVLYENTGVAGKRFLEKIGFRQVGLEIDPFFADEADYFVRKMREEAAARGLDTATMKNCYTMRLEL